MIVLYNLIRQIWHVFQRHWMSAKLHSRFPGLTIEGPSIVRCDELSALEVGNDVHVGAFSEIVVLQKSGFSSVSGRLSIGARVVIGTGANIRAAGGEITIGEHSLLAQRVTLIAANHSLVQKIPYRDSPWATDRSGIVIGKNVWIGTGVVVLPGVQIGDDAVIAAGAVVTGNVPAGQIWGGVPARRLREAISEPL